MNGKLFTDGVRLLHSPSANTADARSLDLVRHVPAGVPHQDLAAAVALPTLRRPTAGRAPLGKRRRAPSGLPFGADFGCLLPLGNQRGGHRATQLSAIRVWQALKL